MKNAMLIIMLAAAPAWAIEKNATVAAPDSATAQAGEATANVAVVVSGDRGTDADHVVMVKATVNDDASSGDEKRIKVITRIKSQGDANRGWLGVALGKSYTVTGDGDQATSDQSVKILNVVKGSPAEAAGLQVGDVVKSLNGQAVENVADLAAAVGELDPGNVVNIDIERDGQPQTIAVTLATQPEGDIEWLEAPEGEFTDQLRALPRVMRLSKHGDLHALDLDDLRDWPDAIAEIVAELNNGATTQLSFGNGQRNLKITQTENGKTVEITQEGDGPIVVKRSTDNGDQTDEVEYADAEALQAGDSEAYQLYHQHQPTAILLGDDGQGKFDFNFRFAPGMNPPDWKNLQKKLTEQFRDADHSLGNANAALGALRGNFMPFGKATRSFKVNPDGQIELTIRKGDTEVVKVFHDEADLAARDPDAFQRYQEVIDSETETQQP